MCIRDRCKINIWLLRPSKTQCKTNIWLLRPLKTQCKTKICLLRPSKTQCKINLWLLRASKTRTSVLLVPSFGCPEVVDVSICIAVYAAGWVLCFSYVALLWELAINNRISVFPSLLHKPLRCICAYTCSLVASLLGGSLASDSERVSLLRPSGYFLWVFPFYA